MNNFTNTQRWRERKTEREKKDGKIDRYIDKKKERQKTEGERMKKRMRDFCKLTHRWLS